VESKPKSYSHSLIFVLQVLSTHNCDGLGNKEGKRRIPSVRKLDRSGSGSRQIIALDEEAFISSFPFKNRRINLCYSPKSFAPQFYEPLRADAVVGHCHVPFRLPLYLSPALHRAYGNVVHTATVRPCIYIISYSYACIFINSP
jgi:hypothetical protein